MIDINYPRPYLRRSEFVSLNGLWNISIEDCDKNLKYQGKIEVPYAIETKTSGVNLLFEENDVAFYRKKFNIDLNEQERLIINFIAVDQVSEVFINDNKVGTHEGGYTPFSFDITDFVKKGSNELLVVVKDSTDKGIYSYGKQKFKRGGIWYTPSSGIVQDVFLEVVPKNYIKDIKFITDIDKKELKILVKSDESLPYSIEFEDMVLNGFSNQEEIFIFDKIHLWSVEDPFLYHAKVKLGLDIVETYFSFRKIERVICEKETYLALNHKRIFLSGVLDQGYYSCGYTAKNKTEYFRDIKVLKDMGFNTIRKHIKLEHPLFYYLCDKLGMLVIQDFINGGDEYKFTIVKLPLFTSQHRDDTQYRKFGRENQEGRAFFLKESCEIIDILNNHPSVIIYTIFNEGWGQFDSKKMTSYLSVKDNTRLYDSTSGWHDRGAGDFRSFHVYFKKFKLRKDKTKRAYILSEFGGYGLKIDGHTFNNHNFGYKKMKNKKFLTDAFEKLYLREVVPQIKNGLVGAIYTQIADVEDELNGIMTFDREIIKIDPKRVRSINELIYKTIREIDLK